MNPAPVTSRRHFLIQSSVALASSSIKARSETRGPEHLSPIRTISHLPHRYHGWGTLAQRRNGQLLLVCSGGRENHVCPFGRVELMTSSDHGKTWTWPQVIHDSAIDDRDAGILETARGTLLATSFTSLAYQPILEEAERSGHWSQDRLQRWLSAHHRLPAKERDQLLGQWMLRSTDGGVTWSEAYPSLVNSPHGPIQLQDGRLLYAGKELWTGQRRVGACESRDEGKSWQWLAEIPTRPGDQAKDYHELHAIETADRRIVVHIRNHNPNHERETLQCESMDGGRSWTQPRSIGVWGLPSHLLKLSDQRLLMSYGYRRPPFGNQARLSEDGGRSWSEPMAISSDGASGDLGYPSTVELDDHSLLTVWYERLSSSPFAVLRQAHWRLPD